MQPGAPLKDDFCRRSEATGRNLFLYSTEELGDYAKSGRSQERRVACVAELFVREFLKKGSAEREINSVLRDDELKDFWLTIGPLFLDSREKASLLLKPFWGTTGNISGFSRKCQAAVRERLTILCEKTDGFIPVYGGNDAFFIPFRFVETENADEVIVDLAGHPVANWTEPCARVLSYAEEALGKRIRSQCVIFCDQTGLPCDLIGNSLMLPLYLACLRKEKAIQYNPLRVLVTGAIDHHGLIAAVETLQKTVGFQAKFEDAFFFFPESTKYTPTEKKEIALPKMDLAHLQRRFQSDVEAKGLFIPTYQEAKERLTALAKDHDVTCLDWEILLNRLTAIKKAFRPASQNPQGYLLCLTLESSILCHMGKTSEAMNINRKAQVFARENNLNKQLLRLQIDELVDFEDMEDYMALAQSAEKLGAEIEKCNDPDLMMRYCGTMGQAHCFGDLSGVKGFSREKAKEYFQNALKYAIRKAETDDDTSAENDVARDLNYLFMWYALFEPESAAAQEAYEDAYEKILRLDLGEGQENNALYLKLYRGMSIYRHLLQKGTMPDVDEEQFRLPPKGWEAALSGKYAGAFMAARGNQDEAKNIFGKYTRILQGINDPVLQFIQMTILAEAFRSTGDAGYRESALALVESLLSTYPRSAPAWRDYLLGQGEFPGLKYWR